MRNVCDLLDQQVKNLPNKTSIVYPINGSSSYKSYTFLELGERINRIANKLVALGVMPQDKVLLFLKPDLDFCAITFALFKLGAVGVFIDPGMPKKMFFKCIKDLEPDVLIAIPKVHFLSFFFPKVFSSVRLFIKNSESSGLRAKPLFQNLNLCSGSFSSFSPNESDLAAILFTSGGTGPAKGVEYTHDIFINQTQMLQKEFNLTKDDTDIPGFPLFSFFTLAMGMTSVIPDMDFAAPAACDAKLLYKNITDSKATFLAGSPAIWERLADFCIKENLKLDSVKFVTMFGAPVKNELHEKFSKILPIGTTYTPYGATECLPVTNISGSKILQNYKEATDLGAGICVGKPLVGVKIEILNPDENGVGAIAVCSKNVTKGYYRLPVETKASKLTKDGELWHKMGDVGYLQDGELWFCGREKHFIHFNNKYFYPTQIEGIINSHPKVKKSALVKVNEQPCIVIEGKFDSELKRELEQMIQASTILEDIKKIFFYEQFPVDIRHNIKIDRIKLAEFIGGRR